MPVNKPETALYRAPTFSHLLASHGGLVRVYTFAFVCCTISSQFHGQNVEMTLGASGCDQCVGHVYFILTKLVLIMDIVRNSSSSLFSVSCVLHDCVIFLCHIPDFLPYSVPYRPQVALKIIVPKIRHGDEKVATLALTVSPCVVWLKHNYPLSDSSLSSLSLLLLPLSFSPSLLLSLFLCSFLVFFSCWKLV